MEHSLKERILDEALILFAENGYKGANLRDLAARLQVSKSALYKHYDSKEAIWNAMLDKMEAHYAQHFGSMDNLPKTPESAEELLTMAMGMIRFTVYDPQVILTRKLLITEQFHDDRVRGMVTHYFLERNVNIYTHVFGAMMEKGLLKEQDPAMLAFSFAPPISALIHQCDREPNRHDEIFEKMEAFIRHFISIHQLP